MFGKSMEVNKKRKNSENLPQTVERALDILETFVDSKESIGNMELSRKVGLNRSTTYRIVQALKKRGYLTKNEHSNKYQLGYKILRIAGTFLTQLDLRVIARKYLEDLTRATCQTAQLAILEGDEVIYVDQVQGVDIFQLRLQIGARGPLHCTAAGKSVLAFLKETEAERLLESLDLKPFTPKTITSAKELREQLNVIRKNGYSFCNGEFHKGVCAVGAPIFGLDVKVKGAVVLTIPSIRIKQREVPLFGNQVKNAALQISQDIGGQPPTYDQRELLRN